MSHKCPVDYLRCQLCDCAGVLCQRRFPGLKVEWPELKGVSAPEAKRIIESENPRVTCIIYPEDLAVLGVNCCNRVYLRVPVANCPNGPVLNRPQIG